MVDNTSIRHSMLANKSSSTGSEPLLFDFLANGHPQPTALQVIVNTLDYPPGLGSKKLLLKAPRS